MSIVDEAPPEYRVTDVRNAEFKQPEIVAVFGKVLWVLSLKGLASVNCARKTTMGCVVEGTRTFFSQ